MSKQIKNPAIKKVLSLMLAAALCFGMTPLTAMAKYTPTPPEGSIAIGDPWGISWSEPTSVPFSGAFYEQLTDIEKVVYYEIFRQVPSSVGNWNFSVNFSNLVIPNTASAAVAENNKLYGVVERAVDALRADYVEFSYLEGPFDVSVSGTQVASDYSVTSAEFTIKNLPCVSDASDVDAEVARLAGNLPAASLDNRYKTVKYIYDTVADKFSYDKSASYGGPSFRLDAVLTNKAVCEGYALLFKALCNELDVPCIVVPGYYTTELHMWNMVKMDDEKWYYVDVTSGDKSVINYGYMLFGDDTASLYNTITTEFFFLYNVASQDFSLPLLASTAYAGGDSDTDDGGSSSKDTTDDSGSKGSSSGNRSGGGGGGGGGGGSVISAPPKPVTSANVDADGKVNSVAALADVTKELSKVASGGTASVSIVNGASISNEIIAAIAAKAAGTGKKVLVKADTSATYNKVNENGTTTSASAINRMTFSATSVVPNGQLNLAVNTNTVATKAVKTMFEKYFNNTVEVIGIAQKGKLPFSVKISAKVDLGKLNKANLLFYSYNNGKYAKLDVKYTIDANGYLVFETSMGGDIIITDKPLSSK